MGIRVVDVFAGPGGLNEGFASLEQDGRRPFSIVKSIEKDPVACRTLRLRAALRALRDERGQLPVAYVEAVRSPNVEQRLAQDPAFARALERAADHVWEFTLDAATRDESDREIKRALKSSEPWVLVGGPPCQLYSLVGRARTSKIKGIDDDVRHVLYKEYLHIIRRHQPDVFVMENVKGMLSAKHKEGQIFDLIRQDINDLDYELYSFVASGSQLKPADFIIRSELYGIPQRRHRVILLGVRKGLGQREIPTLVPSTREVSVSEAIGTMPSLRSRVSPTKSDSERAWLDARSVGMAHAEMQDPGRERPSGWGSHFVPSSITRGGDAPCMDFVTRHSSELGGYIQHEARSHMRADIERYAYYAAKASNGEIVRVTDLPADLRPRHKNIQSDGTPFTDRFRVQRWNASSTTVVSHIAKDGHYFIHPDPLQSRSLTVREAARLQSFPDDYYFCGTRTQQFHQVGNAVPPFLAHQLAGVVHQILTNGTDSR